MIVRLDKNEWWPVYELANDGWIEVDLPARLVKQLRFFTKRCREIQAEVGEHVDAKAWEAGPATATDPSLRKRIK